MSKSLKCTIFYVLVLALIFSFPSIGEAKSNSDKRSLTHDDYDSWKSIVGAQISDDGRWVLYIETPQDGEAELVVKNVENKKEFRYNVGYSGEGTDSERAANPQFSYDMKNVVFLVCPSNAEIREAKKAKKKKDEEKPKKRLGIMHLSDGHVEIIEEVKDFKLPEEAGGWVAYLKEKPEEPEKKKEKKQEEGKVSKNKKEKEYGTSLILRSIQDGSETVFDSVLNFFFTKSGKHLLYVVSSKEKPETDGLYYSPGETSSIPLLKGKGNYKQLTINKDETRVAFLTDREYQDSEKPVFNLYGWNIGDDKASLWVSNKSTPGFPEGMAVSDKSPISFSEDGHVVMFGIKEILPSEKKKEEEEEKAKFDLWHWNDPYPQSQQKKIAKRIRDNTWESVYYPESKTFVKLACKEIPDIQLSRDGAVAFAQSILPYSKLVSYDGSYCDVYVINPKNGEQTLVKEKLYGSAMLSPNGKYVYWFQNGDWYVYDIAAKTTKNITSSLGISFERHDWDTPNPPRSYGIAGWSDNDASILIYDRYDIWEISPDGSKARMVTEGYGCDNDLSLRYVKLNSEEKTIDPKKPLLLRALNQKTMSEGLFMDRIEGKNIPSELIMSDKSFLAIKKAKKSDRIIFMRSAFDEYPDLWVSDIHFSNPQKITNLGKQMEPVFWGKAELRSFLSSDGKPLKGILIKPKKFDPNRKYPLMVYIYETLHQMLHRFRHPSPGSSINPSYYVSNGYVIWMPDIEYETGYPGRDALKCVVPGIEMLIREGFINPKAIGIQGHSWGGYQIAYMVTQTNIFSAAEAGAPVSNMISSYDGIRWGSGMVRQFQYEKTQSRLGASLWEVPLRYIENSPIFWVDKIKTPLLIMHNDEDGAVPWYQGIEFIMALRRLEKEAYMFNYNGEAHGLRKRVNQKDWTRRMAEFFDHHLKGAPEASWMKSGIKAWEKEEEEKEE